MEDNEFTSQFKARLAIKALESEDAIPELAEEHGVAADLIKSWVEKLKTHSETLFLDEELPESQNKVSEKLREYLSLLRTTLDATVNGILVVDREGKITLYNKRFLEMWDIPEQVISGEKDEVAVQHVLDQLRNPEGFVNKINELYDNPEASSKDVIHLKNGRIIERYSLPQRVGDKIVGRVWSFMDVTESRRAREKMNRYGRLLKSINANVEEAILRSTPTEGLIYVNDAFVEMFGYESKEEALSVDPREFYANPQQRWALVRVLENEERISNMEVQYKRKDDSTFWGLANCTLVETNGQKYIDGVILDITQRRRAEEALRQSEEKYRTIVENIEDGYFEADLEGNFTFCNDSLQKILGYPREDLVNLDFTSYMDRENALNIYKVFKRVYETGAPEKGYNWEVITKQGDCRSVEASISLKKDSGGTPDGFRGIVRDITERKRHEKQIQRSLEEKEVLLREIHHRVKNNLAVISGLLFLQADQAVDDTARALLEQSQSRIHSMAMVHEMLYDTHSFSSINPEAYIQKLVKYMSSNLNEGHKKITTEIVTSGIQLHLNESIPCALIINELLTNAYKYAFKDRSEGHILIKFELVDDSKCRLVVADDGIGFEQKPNLSSDADGGLGLFLVNTLVGQIGGELKIEAENGTRFVITFPYTEY